VAVEQGLGGAEPGSRATYIVMFHLYFDSVEAFQTAFGPHAQAIMEDIPNYTDIQPTIQISEVKIKNKLAPHLQVLRSKTGKYYRQSFDYQVASVF